MDQHGREDVVTPAFAEQACPAGSYKVMAFTAPVPEDDPAVNYCDHHFYVQVCDIKRGCRDVCMQQAVVR